MRETHTVVGVTEGQSNGLLPQSQSALGTTHNEDTARYTTDGEPTGVSLEHSARDTQPSRQCHI